MLNEALIAKIQKLRALSRSSNIHEASNAAAAAEKLIAEHQLDEASLAIEAHAVDECVELHPGEVLVHDGERRVYWKEFLLMNLARLYGVAIDCCWVKTEVTTKTFPYGATVPRVGFQAIGRKSDVELLRYQYAYLSSEIERLATAFLRDNTFARGEAKTAGNNFRQGAVEGVNTAMRAARGAAVQQHNASVGNTSAAMVLASRLDAAVELHRKLRPGKFKENGKQKGGRQTYSNVNRAAREAGRRAGEALHTKGALGSGAARQLKGGA